MKILLAAATAAEINPTIDWLSHEKVSQHHGIDVVITGVGMMATTFSLSQALDKQRYDLVLGAGIAGAFDRSIALGECVIVQSEANGDLGAEDHDAFLDVFDIGLQQKNDPPFTDGKLVNELAGIPFEMAHLKKVLGITVNTVSGSESTILKRTNSYQPQVESMEGVALHYVCLSMNTAFLQLRAISNYVTPRDRSSWKIGDAVAALNAQLIDWLKMPI